MTSTLVLVATEHAGRTEFLARLNFDTSWVRYFLVIMSGAGRALGGMRKEITYLASTHQLTWVAWALTISAAAATPVVQSMREADPPARQGAPAEPAREEAAPPELRLPQNDSANHSADDSVEVEHLRAETVVRRVRLTNTSKSVHWRERYLCRIDIPGPDQPSESRHCILLRDLAPQQSDTVQVEMRVGEERRARWKVLDGGGRAVFPGRKEITFR